MEVHLDDIEARVLGCLVEKELTTPDYYPLTLNSLTAACNQKSNRYPVLSLQETDVVRALDRLRAIHLSGERYGAGMRVAKYEHKVRDKWPPCVSYSCEGRRPWERSVAAAVECSPSVTWKRWRERYRV